ncbi:hypothetical protein GGTG_03645 [Gaeumannomyces tritici R3-111a-1]|uniref:Uncharacterized protein n=1 Tax=Gaeumannomyces tritici (strain R3-111a-1) TaxID=644352 RepID=J3NQT9_GAET3|nr:hypothetical protein GGTG_03645 [Gaeumannomyces tritici R3-111a-1]EJT78545.1 hypothetical protein GGTG_03645 [Gaeumannomyces tritici R3-111a-1]
MKVPILAAVGDESPLPFLVSLFDPKTSVKLPPLDLGRSPRDTVTEILHASTSKEHGVVFRFAIEVGVKKRQREEFEWRKMEGDKEYSTHEASSRYTLHRLSSNPTAPSSSSFSPLDNAQTVAELTFRNVLNLKHTFTLELKGAGITGELGDRWTLMVVMTSLGLRWLRRNGRTKKATVGAAQKIHSKLAVERGGAGQDGMGPVP